MGMTKIMGLALFYNGDSINALYLKCLKAYSILGSGGQMLKKNSRETSGIHNIIYKNYKKVD